MERFSTTCDQSIRSLVPARKQCMLPTAFVGGVSDGEIGAAALDYKRDALSARKSWFFEEGAIVCLGAGIGAAKSGPVLTSIQQSLLQGRVTTPSGWVTQGEHPLKPGDWVHHAGIGYHILDGEKPVLRIAEQKGDWERIFPTHGSTPKSGDVFSLWLDHGESPKDQTYACVILPQTSPADLPRRVKDPGFQILSNTPQIQAIEAKDGVRAVFYAAGKIEWSKGRSVESDKPCMVLVRQSPSGTRLYVAEPTQREKELKLKVDGRARTVQLPAGGNAGKTVEVNPEE